LGSCPAPSGPAGTLGVSFRRLNLRLFTVLPFGQLGSLLVLTCPYARMSETFQAKPEMPTSLSRTQSPPTGQSSAFLWEQSQSISDRLLDDFVACYNPANRHDRKPANCFKPFEYDDLLKRDKVSRTSSGSRTKAWKTQPTCLTPTLSLPKLPKTSRPRLTNLHRSQVTSSPRVFLRLTHQPFEAETASTFSRV
jgi:hypothetical protein